MCAGPGWDNMGLVHFEEINVKIGKKCGEDGGERVGIVPSLLLNSVVRGGGMDGGQVCLSLARGWAAARCSPASTTGTGMYARGAVP